MNSNKIASIFLFERKNRKKIIDKIINLFYPTQCIICGKIGCDILCDKCYYEKIYPKIKDKWKIKRYKDKNFDEHMYMFMYKGKVRKNIIDYKFRDKAYLRDLFIKILIKNEKIYGKIKNYDIIIPVPIHKKRKRQRGYNQSELVATKIADFFANVELVTDVLIKEKNTKPQSSLNKNERQKNVKDVYWIQNKEKIKNKRIILFDDIYTTGATVNECSRLLKNNGAKEIMVLTIAKD